MSPVMLVVIRLALGRVPGPARTGDPGVFQKMADHVPPPSVKNDPSSSRSHRPLPRGPAWRAPGIEDELNAACILLLDGLR
jgi:hypothetical protein